MFFLAKILKNRKFCLLTLCQWRFLFWLFSLCALLMPNVAMSQSLRNQSRKPHFLRVTTNHFWWTLCANVTFIQEKYFPSSVCLSVRGSVTPSASVRLCLCHFPLYFCAPSRHRAEISSTLGSWVPSGVSNVVVERSSARPMIGQVDYWSPSADQIPWLLAICCSGRPM